MYNMFNSSVFNKEEPVQELQVQDKQKLIISGSADDHHLIQDDITSIESVPVGLKWDMSDDEFDEYDKAARLVMKGNREFQDESLRRFLRRSGISVYSVKDVVRLVEYKLVKYKTKGEYNFFSFLIESEENEKARGRSSSEQLGGLSMYSSSIFCGFVPLGVVKKINLVLGEFPKLYCLVLGDRRDYLSEKFVAVTFLTDQYSEVFVIDMWNKDEPAVATREE